MLQVSMTLTHNSKFISLLINLNVKHLLRKKNKERQFF